MSFSVLILTKNEEHDLGACLNSLKPLDDVHVFDSMSTDNTVSIAKSYGAHVSSRKFDGYASQRNAALHTLPFKYDWILILDADEVIPKDLYNEIIATLQSVPENVAGFRIQRKDFLFNRWLRYSQISSYYIRLVRKGRASYHREINEVLSVDGDIADLKHSFFHYPFSKGFAHWLNKHNQYSSMEASRWIEEHNDNIQFSVKKALFSKDYSERRYNQKGLFYKIPCRPLIKWCYMVFYRRAFLDGSAGLTYATLQAIYEYFIVLKTSEILKKKVTQNLNSI